MFCSNCGAQNVKDAKFCISCGKNFDAMKVKKTEAKVDKIKKEELKPTKKENGVYTNDSLVIKLPFRVIIGVPLIILLLAFLGGIFITSGFFTLGFIVLPFAIIYSVFSGFRDPDFHYVCPKCGKEMLSTKVTKAPYGKFSTKCGNCFSTCIFDVDNHSVTVDDNEKKDGE